MTGRKEDLEPASSCDRSGCNWSPRSDVRKTERLAKEIHVTSSIGLWEKTALLGTAKIVRQVLETCSCKVQKTYQNQLPPKPRYSLPSLP